MNGLPHYSSYHKISKMEESSFYSRRDFEALFDGHDREVPEVAYLWNKVQHLLRLHRALQRIAAKREILRLCVNVLIRVLQTSSLPPLTGLALDGLAEVTALPWNWLPPDDDDDDDTDDDLQELPALFSSAMRLETVDHTKIQPLRFLVDLVRRFGRKDGGHFEGPRLLYRVHRPNSHTLYHEDAGFCCARWDRGRGVLCEPSEWDFFHHASGHRLTSNGVFKSPYISMTSSPTRALNLVPDDEVHSAEVFLIDSKLLWETSIQVERTTDIANRHGIPYRGLDSRAHYITDTHWVALHWIPADCIVKRMRFDQFREVCSTNAIFRGTDCL